MRGEGRYSCNMVDVYSKKTHSYNISQIRSGNSKPELLPPCHSGPDPVSGTVGSEIFLLLHKND